MLHVYRVVCDTGTRHCRRETENELTMHHAEIRMIRKSECGWWCCDV